VILTPALEFLCEIKAVLAPPVEVGPTPSGLRRIVDIAEGSFEGPLLRGTILPGGADWQILRTDGVAELRAHYVLKTDDGVLIPVRNRGLRHGPEEVLRRIAAGDNVDPSEYYFRTTPVFEAPAGRYEWLNRNVFVATAARYAGSVAIRVFRVC
jgi:Protein of unknown function (DUF3237)